MLFQREMSTTWNNQKHIEKDDGSHEIKAHCWLSLDFFLLHALYFKGVSFNDT